jgi:hypothetical protein
VYEENHLPESDLAEKLQRHAAMLTAYNDGLKDMVHRFSDEHKDVSALPFTIKHGCAPDRPRVCFTTCNRRALRLVGFYDACS